MQFVCLSVCVCRADKYINAHKKWNHGINCVLFWNLLYYENCSDYFFFPLFGFLLDWRDSCTVRTDWSRFVHSIWCEQHKLFTLGPNKNCGTSLLFTLLLCPVWTGIIQESLDRGEDKSQWVWVVLEESLLLWELDCLSLVLGRLWLNFYSPKPR